MKHACICTLQMRTEKQRNIRSTIPVACASEFCLQTNLGESSYETCHSRRRIEDDLIYPCQDKKGLRGRREEARDERVMCLVWGRGCWVVESRGTRETHEEKRGRDELRVWRREKGDEGLSWRGRRDEGW
uniref:Uncharacterized protein n=1 Tax=Salix viminalis TaxID=40686 RepID=A0A6N2LC86_SALVM